MRCVGSYSQVANSRYHNGMQDGRRDSGRRNCNLENVDNFRWGEKKGSRPSCNVERSGISRHSDYSPLPLSLPEENHNLSLRPVPEAQLVCASF